MHDEGVVNGVLLIPDMLSQCLYSHECFSSRVEPPAFLEGRRGQDLDFFGGDSGELCHDCVVVGAFNCIIQTLQWLAKQDARGSIEERQKPNWKSLVRI